MNWYRKASKYEKLCYENFSKWDKPGEKTDIRCIYVTWNPDGREYRQLLKDHQITRGFAFQSGDLVLWDGGWDAHWGPRSALAKKGFDMNTAIPVQAFYNGLMVTDTSKGLDIHESPDAAKILKSHPVVKKIMPKNFDISYYNEAIVGDWSDLEKTAQIEEELDFDWDIDNAETIDQAVYVLSKYNIPHQVVSFPNAEPVIKFKDMIWDAGFIKNALQWVYDIDDYRLDDYVSIPEENFWEGISEGQKAYHATSEDNIESILENGLKEDCRTRGISNRGMPCAVFASFNEYAIESYGDHVFAIDLGLMARDGFTPEVSGETPLEEAEHRQAIAYKLGIEDVDFSSEYASEGLDLDTIAIYSDIPDKYIRMVN